MLKLLVDNVADSGNIQSNPATISTLPIANLQSMSWAKIARTSDTSPISIYLTWLGLEKTIDTFVLAGHNLSLNSTIRFRFYEWSSWTGTVLHDTGTFDAVPDSPLKDILSYYDTTVYLDSSITSRSVLIDIDDQSNLDQYLRFRRIFAGQSLQLNENVAYGMSIGISDDTGHYRSQGGTLFSTHGTIARTCSFVLESGADSIMEQWITDLFAVGKKRDVYLSIMPDHANSSVSHMHRFSAKLNSNASFVTNEPGNQIAGLSFIEA